MDFGMPRGCEHCNPEKWEAFREADRLYEENIRLYGVPHAYGPGIGYGAEAEHLFAIETRNAIDEAVMKAFLDSIK